MNIYAPVYDLYSNFDRTHLYYTRCSLMVGQ